MIQVAFLLLTQSFRQAVLGAGKGTLDDFETVFHTFFQDFPHFFQDFPHFFQDFPHFFQDFPHFFSRFSTLFFKIFHTHQVFHTQIKFSTHKSSFPHTNQAIHTQMKLNKLRRQFRQQWSCLLINPDRTTVSLAWLYLTRVQCNIERRLFPHRSIGGCH